MAASLSAMASPPQGLSALIQMDMSGLDLMLKSLTSAFDAKLENVMGQLTELQRTSAEQQKNHQVQMEDVLSRLAGTVSQGDLDEIKGDEKAMLQWKPDSKVKVPFGSVRGRPPRLLRARLTALAGSALPGERPAH